MPLRSNQVSLEDDDVEEEACMLHSYDIAILHLAQRSVATFWRWQQFTVDTNELGPTTFHPSAALLSL